MLPASNRADEPSNRDVARLAVGGTNLLPEKVGEPPITETRTENWSREVVKEIAMDIGKQVAAYVEVMYPEAVNRTSSTFRLSLRNCIYNEIMAAIEVTDEGKVIARLKDRKKFRRWWVNTYRKLRRRPTSPTALTQNQGNS